MIFEGYFKNYKKNGEGKEYNENDNSVKFEGEYLNGKRYGGKEYDENKNVIIKIQKGKIKELFNNDKLKFIGEYYNNKKWNGIGYDYLCNKQYEIKEEKEL